MPTKKPRITVSLDRDVYRVLLAFSEVSGQPMSQFISRVMAENSPTLEKLTVLLQSAKRAQPQAMAAIGARTKKLLGVAESAQKLVNSGVDLFWDEPSGGRTAAAAGPLAPPSPNRGGQNPPKSEKVTRLRDHRRAR